MIDPYRLLESFLPTVFWTAISTLILFFVIPFFIMIGPYYSIAVFFVINWIFFYKFMSE